jgi:hypothetical protein
MLKPSQTFPLLVVEESKWFAQYNMIYKNWNISHFAMISSAHLVQLLANVKVESRWE